MVAVATVSDDGAAQALVELLTEHEIPVDVRSFGTDSYLGTATPQTYEVRVPEDQLDEARIFAGRAGQIAGLRRGDNGRQIDKASFGPRQNLRGHGQHIAILQADARLLQPRRNQRRDIVA